MITLTIFILSLMGIGAMLFRKIQLLVEPLPEPIEKPEFLNKVKSHIQRKSSFGELLLHKGLSKFRILTLKTENKTGHYLKKLRQRSQQKDFTDDYWSKLKGE